MSVKQKELYCELCEYKTDNNTDWCRHVKTQKHLRGGDKKKATCQYCSYSSSHWNIKNHELAVHGTIEDKMKHKFYCQLCDSLQYTNPQYQKHLTSKHHLKKIEVKNSFEQIEQMKKEKKMNKCHS